MRYITSRRPGRPLDIERNEARRAEILRAAGLAFSATGYAATEVAEVAAALGLTKAAIYHYFKSKEELFLAAVDAKLNKLAEEMAALAEQHMDSLEGIEAACTCYLSFFDRNPDAVELMIQERSAFKHRDTPTYFHYRDTTLGRWVEVVESLVAKGLLRALPPVATLRLVSDLLYGRVITNFFVKDDRPVKEQSREIVDVLLHGMMPRA